MRRCLIISCLALSTLAVSCVSSDSGSSSSAPPATEAADTETTTVPAESTTTTEPVNEASAYTEAGPFPVGVTTLQLETGNKVEIWYPAIDGSTGADSYDVRDFVPEAIRALLTADVAASYTSDATRDAEVADGAFPVVLFSHGYSGMRLQSTFLTTHLASYGMIVVSPDHWSRDLYHVLSAPVGDRASSVTELLASLDLVTSGNDDPASLLNGHVDVDRVVAVGHSAGGGTVLGAAADDRVDAYVSLASGVLGMGGQSSTTTTPPTYPGKPSFFIAGAVDAVVPVDTVTRPSFDAVPGPSRLWVIDGVGHNGFDDFCTFGNGQGIIGVAEASGLGPLLQSMPQLKTLGQDGCTPPAEPVDLGFPIIKHAVTAQILNWVGVDADPVGLDDSVSGSYELAVTIDSK